MRFVWHGLHVGSVSMACMMKDSTCNFEVRARAIDVNAFVRILDLDHDLGCISGLKIREPVLDKLPQ